jgi:hypothetical protein
VRTHAPPQRCACVQLCEASDGPIFSSLVYLFSRLSGGEEGRPEPDVSIAVAML